MTRSFYSGSFCLGALLWVPSLVAAAPAPKALPPAVQQELRKLLRDPALQNGHVGVAVVALGPAKDAKQFPAAAYDGKVQPLLFAENANKRFLPASNMKLFTAAWVLKTLGPDRTLKTKVYQAPIQGWREAWPSSVPLPTVLTLSGDGDPSLSTEGLNTLAKQILARGKAAYVVTYDRTRFRAEEGGGRYPDGWTLDDTLWYYGAPVRALAVNRNQVDVTVTGAGVGEIAEVKASPEAPFSIFAPIITVKKDDPRAGKLRFGFGDEYTPFSGTLTVQGSVGEGQKVTEGIAVPDPEQWARELFVAALKTGGAQMVEPRGTYGAGEEVVALASLDSPPIKTLLVRFLKNSDNLYGEMLLRRAALELAPDPLERSEHGVKSAYVASTGLAGRAHGNMIDWLEKSGVPIEGLRFSDGSGLSRYNMLTPGAIVRLLAAAQGLPGGEAFYNALPVAGVDGTLKNRMKGSAAANNVRAKTGTFSIANCLSGYVTTKDGHRLAVSIMTNFVPEGEVAREWQGKVFGVLAKADLGGSVQVKRGK